MTDFALPETRYARNGDINIAYQTMGEGPVDIIAVPGLCSHIEFAHECPGYTAFLRRFAKFARIVTFDKRGQGLSDRISGYPTYEERMDDVRAIMDEIGSRRAVLFGFSEGCPMSILFTATYPERVSHLVLYGGFARAADMRPPEWTQEMIEARVAQRVKSWGNGDMLKVVAASQAQDKAAIALLAKFAEDRPVAERSNRRHPDPADAANPDPGGAPANRCDRSGGAGQQDGGANPRRQIYRISRRRPRVLDRRYRYNARRCRGIHHRASR
jgi:pimeloyl-ACP methyl ester carboxylesterase